MRRRSVSTPMPCSSRASAAVAATAGSTYPARLRHRGRRCQRIGWRWWCWRRWRQRRRGRRAHEWRYLHAGRAIERFHRAKPGWRRRQRRVQRLCRNCRVSRRWWRGVRGCRRIGWRRRRCIDSRCHVERQRLDARHGSRGDYRAEPRWRRWNGGLNVSGSIGLAQAEVLRSRSASVAPVAVAATGRRPRSVSQVM